jgi:hypothetical protein
MNCRRGMLLVMLAILTLEGHVSVSRADTPGTATKEAGKLFQRGVALYNETDYRAALVEFQRAYDIAPNSAVLYNIGETYFQLQNYAAALLTLERYLSDAGPTATHRAEVEQTLETLQARVGKVAVTTNVPDCDATIDDESVGKTPFKEPVLVSIGRRKITVTCERRPAETRFVDVAAGDTVPVQLKLGEPAGRASTPAAAVSPSGTRANYSTFMWYSAGIAGTVAAGFGVAAYVASRDLKSARGTYPVTASDLSSKSSRVKTLSLIADSATVVAAVAAGFGLYYTLTRTKTHEVRVAATPHGIQLVGAFP